VRKYNMAIAIVTGSTLISTSGSLDLGTGDDRVLIAWQYTDNPSPSAPTIDGVAMTPIGEGMTTIIPSPLRYARMYYAVGLPTGSQTLVVNGFSAYCMVFSGVDQTTPIDAETSNTGATDGVTYSLTTTKTGDWLIAAANSTTNINAAGGDLSAGTLSGVGPAMAHSNGIVAVGSRTGTFSWSATNAGGGSMVAIMPVQPASFNPPMMHHMQIAGGLM
jgi:hypothetical protein